LSKHNSSQEKETTSPTLFNTYPANGDLPDLDFSVINQDDQNNEIKLDTAGAEELSVKTLANMFDFRLGESSCNKHSLKRESKIETIAQGLTLNVTNCSEC